MNQTNISADVPAATNAGDRRARWTAGRITSIVAGSSLVLVALVLLGAGGTALWADRTQRDAGYVTTDVHEFSTSGSALATEETHLGSAGVGWLYSPHLLGKVRIRVTPTGPPPLFVGIGRAADVDRYLAGVNQTRITDFFKDKELVVGGGKPRSAPGTQHFWIASSSGSGTRSLVWSPKKGTWTVVVMNADARPGVGVHADLGARIPAAVWIAVGLLAAGVVLLAGGALLIAGGLRDGTETIEPKGGEMSTPSITMPVPRELTVQEEDVERYAGIRQYSLAQIIGIWAAAALPMAILAWVVAPRLADHLSGQGKIPMIKSVLLLLTAGLIWQFVLVAILVWQEQRTLRWSTVRNALWLRSPRSPKTGRVGGKLWLILIPLTVLFYVEEFIPQVGVPGNRDFQKFLDSDVGKNFMSGAWGWYGLMLLLLLFNTVLGEELLFRGVLLPRMKRVFGRGDWFANGVLFTLYHLHMPWLMPGTFLVDTFAIAYPARRYQSAWIGIAVHSAQSVFFAVIVLTLVL
jgi:membrane protease YdiL (CAAX protease family)